MLKAYIDTACSGDYIGIAGSSGACVQGSQSQNSLVNKYCGQYLNAQNEAMANIAVCDCTAPFQLAVFTDALTDKKDDGTTTPNPALSRGACLEWTQIPCS